MTNDELRLKNYKWNETSEHITAAAAQTCARESVKQTALLQEIRNLLLQLGTDGIHDLIRVARTEQRAAQRARRRAEREAAGG